MSPLPHKTLKEFYPFYLSQHRHLLNRVLHFVGTLCVLILFARFAVLRQFKWLLLAPVAGYAFAWVGHFFVERNRPATFTYPVLSLVCDFVMFFQILTFRLNFKTRSGLRALAIAFLAATSWHARAEEKEVFEENSDEAYIQRSPETSILDVSVTKSSRAKGTNGVPPLVTFHVNEVLRGKITEPSLEVEWVSRDVLPNKFPSPWSDIPVKAPKSGSRMILLISEYKVGNKVHFIVDRRGRYAFSPEKIAWVKSVLKSENRQDTNALAKAHQEIRETENASRDLQTLWKYRGQHENISELYQKSTSVIVGQLSDVDLGSRARLLLKAVQDYKGDLKMATARVAIPGVANDLLAEALELKKKHPRVIAFATQNENGDWELIDPLNGMLLATPARLEKIEALKKALSP